MTSADVQSAAGYDPALFSGYNIMQGLQDDNEERMQQTMRMKIGKLRGTKFDEG
ncbi:hypothetical protein R1Q26_05965 [Klebsiella quasipneumoniae]|uniref:hypothetical protein n=1 Tax=Klebsiella quasipneumoniae TaxID=1463165 RepID=UPI0018D6475F|nr:hypothetical protein [Klebsiella quasipneumoniae]MBH2847046.1 hypothetical protein [Serratia marcescens]MBH2864709.1 hypothetical protein [Serratia marcescens]WPA29263.1 hypothetical protein R1Q26_05965 [Klebsiella quasipneumoniae]